jgi:WD40 repeat protein
MAPFFVSLFLRMASELSPAAGIGRRRCGIMSVNVSPDGRRIVTGSQDQTTKVWDAATGDELLTFKDHKEWVISVAFSPDGERIATGSGDRTAQVWEAASREQVAEWQREEKSAEAALQNSSPKPR